MTKLAIMQPTFLPWLGYFAMIDDVDIFVFLDDVQFSKQSWQNRSRMKSAQGTLTLTVPCKRKRAPICSVQIDNPNVYRKLMRSIELSYSKAPFRMGIVAVLEKIFAQKHINLGSLNRALISEISKFLGIETYCISSSKLGVQASSKSMRLLQICDTIGADTYLSAPGSFDYLRQENPFESSQINLRFFSFMHPVYPQLHGTFEPYLSIIDAIANIGTVETLRLMRSSVMPSLNFHQMSAHPSNLRQCRG